MAKKSRKRVGQAEKKQDKSKKVGISGKLPLFIIIVWDASKHLAKNSFGGGALRGPAGQNFVAAAHHHNLFKWISWQNYSKGSPQAIFLENSQFQAIFKQFLVFPRWQGGKTPPLSCSSGFPAIVEQLFMVLMVIFSHFYGFHGCFSLKFTVFVSFWTQFKEFLVQIEL